MPTARKVRSQRRGEPKKKRSTQTRARKRAAANSKVVRRSRGSQAVHPRKRNAQLRSEGKSGKSGAKKAAGSAANQLIQKAAGKAKEYTTAMHMDMTFVVLLGTVIVFGLIMLSSASSVLGYQNFGDSYYYVKHQLLNGIFLGLIAFYVMSKIEYHYWRKHAFTIAVATIVLLLIVFVPGLGDTQLGAKRWISLGGFNFQPSEVVKLSFLIYLAAWLEKQGKTVEDTHYGFIPFLSMLGVLVLLIAIAQKDLGTMIVIGVISIVVYFVAGAPWKHMGAIFLGGIAAFGLLVAIAPHRINRIIAFIDPSVDPQGIGYHATQALIAVGSGGILGVGLGHSRQKFNYLPEVISDSIFAIIAEEMGFIIALAVIALFLAITLKALDIARKAPDQFGRLIAVGIATWIGFQALVNVGAMLSVLPLTGIPLPFVSYGSSSLMMLLAAAGLLANISRYSNNS